MVCTLPDELALRWTAALFSQHRLQPSHTTRSFLTPTPPLLLSGSHAGTSCTGSTKTTSGDWAAVGCAVENPSGNCVGSNCASIGAVSIGAITTVTPYGQCSITCPTEGGDFAAEFIYTEGTEKPPHFAKHIR